MSKIDYNEKVLQVKDLKKYFYVGVGKNKLVVPAVDGVSFDIHKREVFGLVGESGCGKTTTGRTIIKLYNPTDGSVVFNDIPIGAGYETHVNKIKELKEQNKRDLFKLKPNGEKILELRSQAERQILELDYKIKELEYNLEQDLQKVNETLYLYREKLYSTKNEYVLRVEAHEYEYENKRREYLDSTVNQAKEEFERELAKINLRFRRSSEGLKDSAALEKELIDQKLEEIKEEHLKRVEDLTLKYEPMIEDAQKDICSKKEIKAPLKQIKEKLKEQKALEKEAYEKEVAAIEAPNKEKINARIKELKEENDQKVLEIRQKIKEIKEELKAEEKELSAAKGAEIDKEEVNKLKALAKEKIAEEKQKIKEAKVINRSSLGKDEITKMQMIFQDPISSLNPRMTVREIVAEGLTIQKELSKEEIDEKVKEMLEVVGLSADYMARYPHEFSGGQRQRIGVARALIMEPNLIIADEPISALDVSIRAQVLNLLTDLKDELGLTILFIAHDLSVVRFFCDTIAVMYYGKIVEMAPAEDLFKHPMHPYTISLLSAVPQPDPDYEKGRKRLFYDPRMHDYRFDRPSFREIGPNHFVLANDKEFKQMKIEYNKVK